MSRRPGFRSAGELAAETNRCLRHLEQATRPGIPTGRSAAECYEVIGQLRQAGREFDTTLAHIGAWLEQQLLDGRLGVEDDPRGSDALTAVGRVRDRLEHAHRSLQELSNVLADAQTAASGLVSVPGPAPRCPRGRPDRE